MPHRDSLCSQALIRLVAAAQEEGGVTEAMSRDGDAVLYLLRHAEIHEQFPEKHRDDWWRVATGVHLGEIQFTTTQDLCRAFIVLERFRHPQTVHAYRGSEAIQ